MIDAGWGARSRSVLMKQEGFRCYADVAKIFLLLIQILRPGLSC
jgi:hypothetical protein